MQYSHGTGKILQHVTESALRVFEAAACSIALLDGEGLLYVHSSGRGADQIIGRRLPTSRGLGGFAVTGGETIATFDTQADPRFARDVAEATGYVPDALIAAPLTTDRASYGVLTVLDPAVTGAVGSRLVELVTLLAHQAAITVEGDNRPPTAGHSLRDELAQLIRSLPEEQLQQALEALRDLPRNS